MEGAPFGIREAREWTARAPRPWHRPFVAAIVWIGCVVVTMVVEANPVCGDARPCTGDLEAAPAVGLAVAAIAGALLSPRVGAVAGVLLALLGLRFDAVGIGVVVAVAAFTLGGVTSVVTAGLTERRRRAQLAYVDRLAGPHRVVLPRAAGAEVRRRAVALLAGAGVLMLVGAALCWWAADRVRTERARERVAPVVAAEVVRHTDDGDVVLRGDNRETTYVVYQTDHYPVGLILDAYVVGGELRPVREPYDASLPALAPACVLGLAVVLVGRGGARLRSARLLARDVPALRMRSFVGWAEEVPVIPLGSEWPLLLATIAFSPDGGVVDEYAVRTDPDDEEAAPRQAVVVGELVEGGFIGVYVDGALFAPAGPAKGVATDYLLVAPEPGRGEHGGAAEPGAEAGTDRFS